MDVGVSLPRFPPLWREGRAGLEAAALFRSSVWRGGGVPDGDGRPVLLIPGFMAGDGSMSTLTRWLRENGYRTHRAGIRANVGCSEEYLTRLEARLEKQFEETGERVAIVGQSRGGVFARVLGVRRPDLVSGIVTLGSPTVSQLSAHPFGAMCRRICLRGQPGGRFEETMEMEGTHASGIRQRGETGRFFSRLDSAARRRDQGRLSLSHALSVRMTSLTRTKSCLLRIRNRFKKSDMLSARSTSGAGGPAVGSSRLYAKNKTPVSPTISPQNCAPACVVGACR